jgi:hypothetical protein
MRADPPMKKKEPPEDEYMLLSETLEHVMKATGKTRRQAKAAILQALKSGALRARAEVVVTDTLTGEEENYGVEPVPVEFWQSFRTEH